MKKMAAIAIILILALCTSCGQNQPADALTSTPVIPISPSNPTVSDIFSVEILTGDPYNLFGKAEAEPKDYSEAANTLYEQCYNQPEVLASTLSAFPTAVHECGLASANPAAIDNAMDTPSGGALQQQLLDKLGDLLERPSTQYRFAEWSGAANMLCMNQRDENGPLTPENMMLFWDRAYLQDHSLLAVAVQYDDDTVEIGYFDLDGGFQRFVPIMDDQSM